MLRTVMTFLTRTYLVKTFLMAPLLASETTRDNPSCWFFQSMLFAFGDSRSPKPETAALVEEICQQQMAEIVVRASEVASNRGSPSIGIEDLLFLMRRSPIKIQRLVKVR